MTEKNDVGSNRTFMELKFLRRWNAHATEYSSNRTFMELKLMR